MGNITSSHGTGTKTRPEDKPTAEILSTFCFSTPTAAVIGGGMAGVHVAYELGRLGFEVTVFEQRPDIASGSTAHSLPFVGMGVCAAPLYDTRVWRDMIKGVLWRSSCPDIIVRDAFLHTVFSPEFQHWLRGRRRCQMSRDDILRYSNRLSTLSREVVERMIKEHPSLKPFIVSPYVELRQMPSGAENAVARSIIGAHPNPLLMDPVGWTRALAKICQSLYRVTFRTNHVVDALNVRYRNNTEMISSVTYSTESVGPEGDVSPLINTESFDVVVLAAGGETGALTRNTARLPVLNVSSLSVYIPNPSQVLEKALHKILPRYSKHENPTSTVASLTELHPGANMVGYRIESPGIGGAPPNEVCCLHGLLSTDTTKKNQFSFFRKEESRLKTLSSYLRVYHDVDLDWSLEKITQGNASPTSADGKEVVVVDEYHLGVTPDGLPLVDFYGGYFNGFVCTAFGNRTPDFAPGAAVLLQKLVDHQAQEILVEQQQEAAQKGVPANHLPSPRLYESKKVLQQLFNGQFHLLGYGPQRSPMHENTQEAMALVDVNPYGTNRFRSLVPPRRNPDYASESPFYKLYMQEEKLVRFLEPWVNRVSRWVVEQGRRNYMPRILQDLIFSYWYDLEEPTEEEKAEALLRKQMMDRIIAQHEGSRQRAPQENQRDESGSQGARLTMEEQARRFFTDAQR